MYLCRHEQIQYHRMRKYLLTILLMIWAASASAQGELVFSPAEWDFGTIAEADGTVTHTFTGENRGNKPIVILDVAATCGCTVPEFSKQPILPGGKTTVKVTFDPSNRPGVFVKELSVYSTERIKIATLTIRGSVTARPKSIAELYPVDAGNGLRLTSTLCAFAYIYQGLPVTSTIGYANTSHRMISLDLRNESPSGLLSLEYPRQIAPGERGEINLGYSIRAAEPRYGTVRDLLEVRVNDHSNRTQLLVHGIGVDKSADTENAPKSELSDNIIKLGIIKHNAPVRRYAFTLSNMGGSTLIVRAVETGDHIGCTLRPGQQIPAGGATTAELTLDPSKQNYGVVTDQLTLITNDPARPMRRIRVTAIIED